MPTIDMISDEQLKRVHANANFGTMTPRDVINDGIRKIAIGYTCGHTQGEILHEHGLTTKAKKGRPWSINLTEFGKRYARQMNLEGALYRDEFM
jgi:hypothetical protein